MHDGYILCGTKVVIPPPGREQLLEDPHKGYPWVGRMKSLAQMFVWWLGINESIEETVYQCTEYQQNQSTPPRAPPHSWEWPSKPWLRLHVDFTEPVHSQMFLVIVNAHSEWVEVYALKLATSTVTIQYMRPLFGLPDTLVLDNSDVKICVFLPYV